MSTLPRRHATAKNHKFHRMTLFDQHAQQRQTERAKRKYTDNDRFLYKWAKEEINIRTDEIKRNFTNIKHLNDFNEEPPSDSPYDYTQSIFQLHKTEDPNQYLTNIKKNLKPDGLCLGVCFGDGTLTELKQSLINAEIHLTGGSHQRATPLMTKQQIGGFMQSAGFALPVVDSETVRVDYKDILTLYSDLRAMGETNMLNARSRKPQTKQFFEEVEKQYASQFFKNGTYSATFEIIFFTGWAPDTSQQQPLRPGSGKTSLKDVL